MTTPRIPHPVDDFLDYRDGKLYWKKSTGARAKVGAEAGARRPDKYIYLMVNNVQYYAHRLIWEMHFGSIPEGMMLDHINRDRTDNRIENLRLATPSQNLANQVRDRTLKFKGVWWHPKSKAWNARIKVNGRTKSLGYRKTQEEAARLYDEAAKIKFGEFAVLNFPEGRSNEQEIELVSASEEA